MRLEPKIQGMRSRSVAFPAVALLLLGSQGVAAQSLADVARQEEARRKDIKQPAKVITNKDLPNVPPPEPPPSDAPADKTDAASGKADKDAAAAAPDGQAKAPAAPKEKDEAYWSGRMKDLRTLLERDQTFAEALQSRINALTTDFSARDDPAQRDAIGRDRQRAISELDRVKKAIVDDEKAVADLQEEARRAAVPPGWLR